MGGRSLQMAREPAVIAAPDARRPPAVAVVELEDAAATRLAECLPTYPDAVLTSIDAFNRHAGLGGPTVAVFGPTFANPAGLAEIQEFTRSRPDVGVILIARRVMTKLLKGNGTGRHPGATLSSDRSPELAAAGAAFPWRRRSR